MNDMNSTPVRKIVHVDMDAFYASVEQRDNPELRGKPIAVGGSAARGVVAAASYEARVFSIHSAMPSVTAKRKCPELIFVPPRFDVYKLVSQQIREIFAEYTSMIEPLSLDEAYLDVTQNLKGMEIATDIATEIRARIKQVTGLNASAGISYNKFLAKMASDLNKPNGQVVITPKKGPVFVEALPVKKFHGVGPATAEKMHRLGIDTGADLKGKTLEFLVEHFGKSGPYFHGIARGIDERQVKPNRVRKSVGAEDTFSQDLHAYEPARQGLQPLIEKVWAYCEANEIGAKTVTLKVKYADFTQITRSKTIAAPLPAIADVEELVGLLLSPIFPPRKGIRLLGVTLSSLERRTPVAEPQLRLAL
ncbi:DNA polymerase IV [Rhizobium hidalgonense]|uniref:DNA polymerase IV n=1 Tax=Rhizobium hidalgonense TaxID=1538159 RepID=A0A2A6K824_9HYPH|nr:DNA polymerase IV [Rhizobium hidalgonense]MDR9776018.1 DNA polymerase IV [Rhizobium hidalgonense]MDR9814091.1 DNA polymerase IV [Rhizobium hidalgonense]MDR9820825.1 DNA polymerase IV [Rhizobium hidalgonense]PDT20954.1 DNA polymerase IV [Rhizobium hidalgonense]PON07187.1 DNA polymerase IV [Rhizobium hidalgonense]